MQNFAKTQPSERQSDQNQESDDWFQQEKSRVDTPHKNFAESNFMSQKTTNFEESTANQMVLGENKNQDQNLPGIDGFLSKKEPALP